MKKLFAALAALLAVLAASRPRAIPPRPDVVLIVVDTLRRDHLPVYGYAQDTAPFLSALAARGAVFENAYSTSAWTAPATASLFTGLYPLQHGVVTGRWAVRQLQKGGVPIRLNRIPRAAETIPEALKRAGYSTWAVTENSNIRKELGFDQGFDHFYPLSPSHRAETITAKLKRLRPEILAERPYFLYVHYMDPHEPYAENPPHFDSALEGDARRASAYDSEIRHVDAHIQRAFEMFGWHQGTFLMLTADHGEELGERGAWGHARTLFAETLNVPLVAHGPGVPAGLRIRERVSHVDVLPTLRALLGREASSADAGESLVPLLSGERDRLPERALFADFWQTPEGRRTPLLKAVIRGSFKRIDGEPGGPLLFQLDADPFERTNRSGAQPRVAEELRLALERFERSARRFEPEFEDTLLDEKLNEELRALGYVN